MINKTLAIIDAGSFSLPYDYYYIEELSKQGYTIDFYCSDTKYNNNLLIQLQSNKNVYIKSYKISSSVNNSFGSIMQYLKLLKDLMFNYSKYSYIHFMWLGVVVIDLFLFIIIKNKLIFTFHNHKPHSTKKQYLPYKVIYRLANKIVFISNFTKKQFITEYDINNIENIYLFNHGILPFDENNFLINKNKIEKTIVFWGNVKDYKGVDVFLPLVNSGIIRDWNIEIHGKWDKKLNSMKEDMSKTRIKIFDKFLLNNELKILFDRNVIFILPYKDATQSGVLYTLLNYSQIFISTNKGDNGEFLNNYNLNKLLFNRGSVKSIIESLKYCELNNKILRQKISDIKKEYMWGKCMKNISRLYLDK